MVSFDTNLRLRLWSKERARAVITDMMGHCDICLPSYDDVVVLTGIEDEDALVDFALARGAKIVALKLGERGAIVASPTERHRIAASPVTAVDATGAGDTFGGAFVTTARCRRRSRHRRPLCRRRRGDLHHGLRRRRAHSGRGAGREGAGVISRRS